MTVLASVWRAPWARRFGVASTVVAAGATQLSTAWSLWEAMGITIMPVVTFFVAAIITLVLAPSAERLGTGNRKAPLLGLALAGAFVLVALVLPAYSEESPRALNIHFVQDAAAGEARLAVLPRPRSLPDSLATAVDWNDELERFYPWDDTEPAFLTADVEALPVSPPQIELLEQEETEIGRRIRARFHSPRQAARGALVFDEPAAYRVVASRRMGFRSTDGGDPGLVPRWPACRSIRHDAGDGNRIRGHRDRQRALPRLCGRLLLRFAAGWRSRDEGPPIECGAHRPGGSDHRAHQGGALRKGWNPCKRFRASFPSPPDSSR